MTAPMGWVDARAAAFAAASGLPTELVPVLECVGRTLARDLGALQDVPHFASSAMDGWAVAGDGPWRLESGGDGSSALALGSARAIVTGGIIGPGVTAVLRSEHGVTAVLRSEHGQADDVELRVRDGLAPPADGRDIRRAATEARAGDVLIRAGVVLNPAHAAIAAGGGHDTVAVAGRPRVALLTTGSEVVAAGVPAAGFVRDSFGPMLPAAISGFAGGARVVSSIRMADDRQHLVDALQVRDADVVVTTGGTADSPVDHIRSVLHELGATLIVDGLDVRPGSPSLLAQLPSGVFVVALPGNPLAAVIGLLVLLEPLLAGLAGHQFTVPSTVVVGDDHAPGRLRMMPYRLVSGRAIASGWRDSGMLRGLADAQGVLIVPADGLSGGDPATTLRLPWPVT